ncbi:MAG TPA: hypothetical protein VEM38_12370 [Burkholderiales bacterium]|nr:hypothetical protein [Burkholderiales bacterium]
MLRDPAAAHVAAIYNAAWPVRALCRPHQHERRARAWRDLGLTARAAFNASDQFTPILLAIAHALKELT